MTIFHVFNSFINEIKWRMVLVEIFWEWKEQELNHSSFIYDGWIESKWGRFCHRFYSASLWYHHLYYLTDWTKRKRKIFVTSKTLVAQSVFLVWWNYESWGMGEREREREFVLYFTASFCLNILYYLAYGTENEFKIIPLRTFDGQQITHLIFGHNLLSVKKNVNTFALKFKYCFI